MQAVTEFLKAMGPTRLAAMGVVAITLVGVFAFLILRLSTPHMVPLYSDLDVDDSSAIVRQLESTGIPFALRHDGGTIMVPDSEVVRLRMDLASSGLPSGGGVGYEIFDKSDTLGATSFVQNVNHLRALEGELSRSIRSLDRVRSARVHLVLPERQLFSREQNRASASIMLETRGAIEPAQIRAIQHLAAAAVEGLDPGRVSVVDQSGRLLADGRGDDNPGSVGSLDERRTALERQLRSQIEEIVASVVGRDRMRVQVAAELDFNRISETSEHYDPDGRVIRSLQTREEATSSSEAGEPGVTVANQLPDAELDGQGEGRRETTSQNEEVVNYEISRTTRNEVTEAGRVRRLSVAVVVDGIYAHDASGDTVYSPREQEQLDRIAALVRSAIGFDEARGDRVEVANLRFAEPPLSFPAAEADPLVPALTRNDMMRFAELAVLGLIAALLIVFVARPLVRRMLAKDDPQAGAAAGDPQLATAADEAPQLPSPAHLAAAAATSEAIEYAQIAGEVQASSLKRVGELIDHNPKEAITIIRNWIHEPAA